MGRQLSLVVMSATEKDIVFIVVIVILSLTIWETQFVMSLGNIGVVINWMFFLLFLDESDFTGVCCKDFVHLWRYDKKQRSICLTILVLSAVCS